jgi:hypothetical protein
MTVTIEGQQCSAVNGSFVNCVASGISEAVTLEAAHYDMVKAVVLPSSSLPTRLKVAVASSNNGSKCLVSATVVWFEAEVAAALVAPSTLMITATNFEPLEGRRLRTRREVVAQANSPEFASQRVCVRSEQQSDQLGMGMLEVQMPSGWVLADLAATKDANPGAIRIEDKGASVAFYLDTFTEEMTCFDVMVVRVHMVEDVQPVFASVYSYYQPDIKAESKAELVNPEALSPCATKCRAKRGSRGLP